MATDTARSATPPAARHLWQVPALFLGVAAVIAVLTVRPNSPDTPAAADHLLREARRALEQSPPDAATALQKVDRVLALADRYPQLAGEAHFLAGSAHLRLADEPGDAVRERQLAHQHLDQAAALRVSETDQPKLNYRLAKVALLLGGDPVKAVALLEKSANADDPAEGYGLLALAYSRLTPPDLDKAEKAARQQLDQSLRTSDTRLQASARFRLGELNLKLKKIKEGRQMLSKVGTEAGPEQNYSARVLLAESYEETQEWENAARNWKVARENEKLANAEKANVLYHLGWCDARAQLKEAAGVFMEAIALGGPDGQAAGLRLAELKLESDPAAAVAAMAAALQSVQGPGEYRNPLVPIEDVRQDIEKAVLIARDAGNWDLARAAIEIYARVAVAGKDDELAGQVFDAQGQSLTEKAKTDAANQATMTEQANEAFRQAAAAYERAAGKVQPGPDQATWLWRSAQLFLRAGQIPRVLEILTRVTQLGGIISSDSMAEAWLLIGNTYHTGGRLADARAAFQNCLAIQGPIGLKARLALAKIDLAENKFDAAEIGLQEVLKVGREVSQSDPGVQEQALFDWAQVPYLRQGAVKDELREYRTAEERLRGAIAQYPDGLAAAGARIVLGKCYWNDARTKSQALERSRAGSTSLSAEERNTYLRQRDDFLRQSAEQYETVEKQMLARERTAGRLTPEEADYLKKAAFWGTDCFFWLHQYEESVRRFGALALRYQGRPEELIALSQIWQSYMLLNQPDKAATLIARMHEALPKISDSAFDGRLDTHRREYWVNWLNEVAKPPIPPAPPQAAAGK
jgi:tetratricopeptide (TPR) repeat protein